MNISIVRLVHLYALVWLASAQTPSNDAVPTVKLPEAPTAMMNPEVTTVMLPESSVALNANQTATTTPTAASLNETTLSPTSTPPPNECSFLEPGDVNVIIFNSEPLDQIVFFTLKDLQSSVKSLYVTDKAWNGTDFVTNEGVLEYSIPEDGIKAGSTFGYGVTFPGQNGEWLESDEEVLFDLSTIGSDSILVYCLNSNDKPVFLSALAYSDNGFAEPGKLSYGTNETALPETLADVGSLSLPFSPHYLYNGPFEGRRDDLLEAFSNPSNFQGSLVPYEIGIEASSAKPVMVSFGLSLLMLITVSMF